MSFPKTTSFWGPLGSIKTTPFLRRDCILEYWRSTIAVLSEVDPKLLLDFSSLWIGYFCFCLFLSLNSLSLHKMVIYLFFFIFFRSQDCFWDSRFASFGWICSEYYLAFCSSKRLHHFLDFSSSSFSLILIEYSWLSKIIKLKIRWWVHGHGLILREVNFQIKKP